MPPRKRPADGRWFWQFMSPPSPAGVKKRLFVQCTPAENSKQACLELGRAAAERWRTGHAASSMSLERFVRDKFLPEYPAAKNLSKSWTDTLTYLFDRVILPHIGTLPIGLCDAAAVARLLGKLREETRDDGKRVREEALARRPPRGLAAGTIDGACKVAELVLSWAAAMGVSPDLRFEAVALQYLHQRATTLSASTIARVYGYHLHRHAIPVLGDTPIGKIDDRRMAKARADLADMRRPSAFAPEAFTRDGRPKRRWELARERRRTGKTVEARRLSDQTIRHAVIAIKGALGWAVKTGHLPRVPEIAMPKVARARVPIPYTAAESIKLLEAAHPSDFRVFLLLAFDAGVRKSEALGLQWSQIDGKHHTILLDRQRYRGDMRACKSGKERTVSMSPELEAALRELRHLRGPFVFCDEDGAPWSESYVRTRFERTVQAAGLRKLRWHDNRHAFATNVVADGASAFELQAALGHADIKTTQRYVHAATRVIRSVLSRGDE